jgi:hypothetical protein
MFELSIHFASEEFEDGQPRSSLLVYFSGVLTRLSGLIYVLRLLFLEYALPYRKYTYLEIDRRPRHKHLERLNAIRHRFMLYGCLTPLGEFQSLRDCARVAVTREAARGGAREDMGIRPGQPHNPYQVCRIASLGTRLAM